MKKKHTPTPETASRRKPLSPVRALQNEIRTLDRAEEQTIADCVKDEVATEKRFNRMVTGLERATSKLRRDWVKHCSGRERRTAAALRAITTRRNRLKARLAAI